jgi:flagellar FliJ protein
MKKFHFPLEALLRLRKRKEDAVKRELADKNRQIMQAQSELRETEQRLKELQAQQKLERGATTDILSLRQSVAYRHTLKSDLLTKGNALIALRQELDGIRRKLVQATKDKRALEIVREKRMAEWRAEYNAEEQEFIDDVSQKEYIRKKKQQADISSAG